MGVRKSAWIPILLLAGYPPQLSAADDCERAEEIKFMIKGKTLAELLARVGPGDYVDYGTVRIGPRWVSEESHIYLPLCDNQTIFTIRVQGGRIVEQERQIQR